MSIGVERVLSLLERGEIELLGIMPRASNYTFAVSVDDGELRSLAVYKPQEGETPLWDFPDGTLWRREVAAYRLAVALGWRFVPPTVQRDGPHGIGSLQLFINATPNEHYFTLMQEHADIFRSVCAFDLLANNADRKAGHCLREDGTGAIFAIDHGVCFHEQDKLRTVMWDFAGDPLPEQVVRALAGVDAAVDALTDLLADDEIAAVRSRCDALLGMGHFPEPPEDRRAYPWPPI